MQTTGLSIQSAHRTLRPHDGKTSSPTEDGRRPRVDASPEKTHTAPRGMPQTLNVAVAKETRSRTTTGGHVTATRVTTIETKQKDRKVTSVGGGGRHGKPCAGCGRPTGQTAPPEEQGHRVARCPPPLGTRGKREQSKRRADGSPTHNGSAAVLGCVAPNRRKTGRPGRPPGGERTTDRGLSTRRSVTQPHEGVTAHTWGPVPSPEDATVCKR